MVHVWFLWFGNLPPNIWLVCVLLRHFKKKSVAWWNISSVSNSPLDSDFPWEGWGVTGSERAAGAVTSGSRVLKWETAGISSLWAAPSLHGVPFPYSSLLPQNAIWPSEPPYEPNLVSVMCLQGKVSAVCSAAGLLAPLLICVCEFAGLC